MKATPSSSEFFYHAAIASCVVSGLSLVVLLFSTPLLLGRIQLERELTAEKAERFRTESNSLWERLQAVRNYYHHHSSFREKTQLRRGRSAHAKAEGTCANCKPMACQPGAPGLAGPLGEDGNPGEAGAQGAPGEDGVDVALEPEHEMPCTMCPAGPYGPRGMQGERGRPGPMGTPGAEGEMGKEGGVGPPGAQGPAGPLGNGGRPGMPGAGGEQVISGVGIKGPPGQPGMMGQRGGQGPPGKSVREGGPQGPAGEKGPAGAAGAEGHIGEVGPHGSQGEPGKPGAYCHSDCGVVKMVAPPWQAPPPGPQSQATSANEKSEKSGTENKYSTSTPVLPHRGSPQKESNGGDGGVGVMPIEQKPPAEHPSSGQDKTVGAYVQRGIKSTAPRAIPILFKG